MYVYMFSSLEEELFFSQKVVLKKKYSNRELSLYQYFYKETNISPENVIVLKKFIFFFVKNEYYFKAGKSLKSLRSKFSEKKILIIRAEKQLSTLLLSFFPDPYVHDMKLKHDENMGMKTISIYLLSYEERGIAVGRSGDYIKAINEIFKKYLVFEEFATFEKYKIPIQVKVELTDLELPRNVL